ncbi:hypothetical protein KKF55_00285 [Patescibacteria group bacterium]|nr:hypothetical protein [Patescibacteria group bacterium]
MKCSIPNEPKCIAGLLLRVGFGLSLLFVGLSHYMTFEGFKSMTMDGLGVLEPLGLVWAFVLPALMILGGALFVINMYKEIATWAAGLALVSIPVGMLIKPILTNVALGDMMGPAINAFIWIIVYVLVVKISGCCGGSCGTK